MSLDLIKKQARALLENGKTAAAIDLIRVDASNTDADLVSILAHCYYKNGDTKGDVHSSCYFAGRAIDLGHVTDDMYAIRAIGEFRKQEYEKAIESFAAYVTADSPENTKNLYGIALHYAGKEDESKKWLTIGLPEISEEEIYRVSKPENIGGLYKKRQEGLDTPYKTNALSKQAGFATSAKDFYWQEKNVPCQAACPAGTNVPNYLAEVYKGNFRKAYEINLVDNVLPGVLGRICARPCEEKCRHGWEGLGDSVAICFSKRSAHDLRVNTRPVVLPKIFENSGKRVAIIGAGPSGLATARELARLGHEVKIFEKHDKPGGMLNQAIPEFRLPRDIIAKEIEQVTALGVQIVTNCAIGEHITLEQLDKDYDAVVMAAGTLRPNVLNLPGKELKGIKHGLQFLLEVNEDMDPEAGKSAIVIGGGFTAMDCARTAKRLGTKLVKVEDEESQKQWEDHALHMSPTDAKVLYRRSPEEMLVTPGEVEELGHENISMDFLISPVEYIGDDNGKVKAVRFIKNELGEPDESGRRRPKAIEGSEFDIDADQVLLATGQFPATDWINGELSEKLVAEDGWLKDYGKHSTSVDGIFAAGDFSTGASSVIQAIAHGKKTATKVDEYLMGEVRLVDAIKIEDAPQSSERIIEMNDVPRIKMPTLALEERTLKAEVEKGYDPELGVEEAQRCYQCNVKYEIDPDKCIYCEWCHKARSRPDCIVRIKELNYGENGEIIGYKKAKITEEASLIYMNQEDCIRCNLCVEACPVDAISVQRTTKTKCAGSCCG